MTQLSLGPGPAPSEPIAPPSTPQAPVVNQLASTLPGNIEVWPGGRVLIQDTTNFDSTGRPYKIRPMDMVYWKIGKDDRGFNWPRYTLVESHTDDKPGERAEHVADTARFDKHGTATAFGRVTEMNDFRGKGAVVGCEIDIRLMSTVSDADAADNGLRFAFDAVVAGSTSTTDPVREVGATAFVRTGGANPFATWSFGAVFGAIKDTGVRILACVKGAVYMINGEGTFQVGFSTAQANLMTGEALRMAAGQSVSFEATGCRKLRYKAWTGDGQGDRWQFMNGDVPVLEIDGDGNIYKRGIKVL